MKKLGIILFLLSIFIFSGCNNEEGPDLMNIRQIAWDSLSEEAQSTVTTDWREAKVEINTSNYYVIFNTNDDPLLGPIVVYINQETLEVEGYAPRY